MSSSVSAEKEAYAERMNRLLDTYSKVLFCNLDNVGSQQMHKVRRDLRGIGEFLVGKKTLQKKIIAVRAEAENASETDKALAKVLCTENMLVGNLGLLFTNGEIAPITDILTRHRVQAPARVGAIAPVDVVVPAGNTGLEPTMTNFFQALNIATKIAKGTVEITTDKKVLSIGDKVDNSTAALLGKLKISPFFYQVEIEFFWDNGLMFTKEDLAINDSILSEAFKNGITNLTAVSLATGVLTEASFPHVVLDAFKNLLGAAVATDYSFDEFNGAQLRKDVLEGKAAPAGGAAPAAAPAGGASKAAPAAAEESSDDDGMGMDLFD